MNDLKTYDYRSIGFDSCWVGAFLGCSHFPKINPREMSEEDVRTLAAFLRSDSSPDPRDREKSRKVANQVEALIPGLAPRAAVIDFTAYVASAYQLTGPEIRRLMRMARRWRADKPDGLPTAIREVLWAAKAHQDGTVTVDGRNVPT